jgi:hypothetical protein
MGNVIKFKGKNRVMEFNSSNIYSFSPVNPTESTLDCVLLYDFKHSFYRLNIFKSNGDNLFSNLFVDTGLSFDELQNNLSIYRINISNEIIEKIKNEPMSTERKQRYDYIISNTEFL